MARIWVGDLFYNVERSGIGAPLVLLHGFTGSGASWGAQVDAFASVREVFMVDLLGHGASDAPMDAGRYTMERTVADLAALFDTLGFGTVDLLGYSMGGRVALATAVTFPARIRSLILESASPGLRSADERQARAEADARLADRLERAGLAAFVDYWENLPLFDSQKRLPDGFRERLRALRLGNSPVGLANSLRGLSTGRQLSYWDALPALTLPTLLIAGALDAKYAALADEMRATMRSASLALVPGAGHTVHLEHPDAFNALVLDFLS